MKTIKKIFVISLLMITSITSAQSYVYEYNTIDLFYEKDVDVNLQMSSNVDGVILTNNSFSKIIIEPNLKKNGKYIGMVLKRVNDIDINFEEKSDVELRTSNYIDKVSDGLYTILLKVDVVKKEIHYLVLKKQTENFSLLFINE